MTAPKPAPAGGVDVRPNRAARRAADRLRRRERGRALRVAHEALSQAEAAWMRTHHLRFRPSCMGARATRAYWSAGARLRALLRGDA